MRVISCPRCDTILNPEFINTNEMIACSTCKVLLRADVYPAFFRPLPLGNAGETLMVDEEASCFFHPRKKAVVECSACGRFLCTLCDVEFNDQHLCPLCLEKGKSKRKIKNLETSRTCYDTIALYLSIVPLLFFWPTILTAPIALFISIRYWKAPSSIISRTKIRFFAAMVIATLQIVGWILFFRNFFS